MNPAPMTDLPSAGRYKLVLADPPWHFQTRTAEGQGRSAIRHYDTMSIDQIAALPVRQICAPSAWLFMWATWTHLPSALDVMRWWGFTYSGIGFLWAKTYRGRDLSSLDASRDFFMGMGYTTRANTEPCILGHRGSPRTRPERRSAAVRELIVDPVREHSRKPDCVTDRCEQFARGPYLEMFARTSAPGWDVWGNEVDKFERTDR